MKKPTNESKALISNFHGLINAPINQRNWRAIVGFGYRQKLGGPIHRKGQQTSNNTKYCRSLRAQRPNSPTAHKPNQLPGSECIGLHQRDAIKQWIPFSPAQLTYRTPIPCYILGYIYIWLQFSHGENKFSYIYIYANCNLI
jgi:hypothetical protein